MLVILFHNVAAKRFAVFFVATALAVSNFLVPLYVKS